MKSLSSYYRTSRQWGFMELWRELLFEFEMMAGHTWDFIDVFTYGYEGGFKVGYRTLNQRVRHWLYCHTSFYWRCKALSDRLTHLAWKKELTREDREEMSRINWLMGSGSEFSGPEIDWELREKQNTIADEILQEVLNKE